MSPGNQSSLPAASTDRPSPSPGRELITPSPSCTGQVIAEVSFNHNSSGNEDKELHDGRSLVGLDSTQEPTPGSVRLHPRRQTYTSGPLRAPEDQSKVSNARRQSSSWLQRMSFLSSRTESLFSSQSPASPSINGSTTPLFRRSSSQRREPNKLVKRPTSQHSLPASLHGRSSRSKSTSSGFGRPATSYQRYANLRRQAAIDKKEPEPLMTTDYQQDAARTDITEGHTDAVWRPYFNSIQDEFKTRSVPSRHSEQPFRRVGTDSPVPPTLLLASTIMHGASVDGPESDKSVPTPRPQFKDPFQSAKPSSKQATPRSSNDIESPRRSLSFNEMVRGTLPTSPASKKGSVRRTCNASVSQGKVRNISSPLPQRSDSYKSEMLNSGVPPLRRKRHFTDPTVFRRPQTVSQVESSIHAFHFSGAPDSPNHVFPSLSQFSELDMDYVIDPFTCSSTSHLEASQRKSPGGRHSLGSTPPALHHSQTKRVSIATSDPASTLFGSDDTRVFTSGEEDETDFQSDTAFDSFRTRATTSTNSGIRGPRIETIFDENSRSELMEQKLAALEDLIPCSPFSTQLPGQYPGASNGNMNSESTPVRLSSYSTDASIRTSEPFLSFPLHQRDSSSLWLALADETKGQYSQRASTPPPWYEDDYDELHVSFDGTSAESDAVPVFTVQSDSPGYVKQNPDTGTRMSLFDWSEQSRSDQGSTPRPKTVHGKQGCDMGGIRIPGRKAPSAALHLRSQSVPVARELAPSNESRQSSGKFGTWGLGSKGASEDWDSDFEFDDSDENSIKDNDGKSSMNTSHYGMKVPQAIMERQASVQGQFGQVQELTLLVEELKRLRLQANVLHIVHGPSNELWKEAEGIVNLATVDDEEDGCSLPQSPSSPTFSFIDFEEESPSTNKTRKRNSIEVRRSSFSGQTTSSSSTTPGRSHKESSVQAKSVLEAIYQQRGSRDPLSADANGHPQQKLPFDTQSLRDLVVRAGVVTRALKEIIRKAEGAATATDDEQPPPDPPFSRIFDQPSHNLSTDELANKNE
ncbi:hypothetical protein VTN00DRAFT_5988 [Thermoascus crustaceus]|uniref:uncharacterized protein n=1 Tax=Thermoascus crustaceus TaxID=5088 RepID=UPI0037433631